MTTIFVVRDGKLINTALEGKAPSQSVREEVVEKRTTAGEPYLLGVFRFKSYNQGMGRITVTSFADTKHYLWSTYAVSNWCFRLRPGKVMIVKLKQSSSRPGMSADELHQHRTVVAGHSLTKCESHGLLRDSGLLRSFAGGNLRLSYTDDGEITVDPHIDLAKVALTTAAKMWVWRNTKGTVLGVSHDLTIYP